MDDLIINHDKYKEVSKEVRQLGMKIRKRVGLDRIVPDVRWMAGRPDVIPF